MTTRGCPAYTALVMTADDLLRHPATDPTAIYRYRDGLYASDLLTAAICHADFFTWLAGHPAPLAGICGSLGLKERPVDVMLTLFTAMGLVERDAEIYRLTELAKEHLCPSSPWCIAPYFASVKARPVCVDMAEVLRTGKPAPWASLRNEKEWARAMEDRAFAGQFTAARSQSMGGLPQRTRDFQRQNRPEPRRCQAIQDFHSTIGFSLPTGAAHTQAWGAYHSGKWGLGPAV